MMQTNRQGMTLARVILALAGILGVSMATAAPVARVDFAIGPATAVGLDGKSRPLVKGGMLDVGDTVNTATGRAQLRFTDGGMVSLLPQTVFKIDDYRYEGKADGSEKGVFSLAKGALRTITGIIGRQNRQTYKLNTEVATIGIRGTEYLASLRNSLSVSVGEGAIALTNKAGEFVVFQGQSAYVADSATMPVLTFSKPVLPPEQAPQRKGAQSEQQKEESVPYVAGDQVSSTGTPVIIGHEVTPPTTGGRPPVSTSTDGNLTLSAYSTGGYVAHAPVTVGFNSQNVATQLYDQALNVWTDAGTATVEGQTGTVIGWSRWTNGSLNDTGSTIPFVGEYTGVHHVFGQPTPLADIQALSGAGTIATYSVIGYTTPTFSDNVGGGLGNGVMSGGFTLHFGDSTFDSNMQLSFQNGANVYSMAATGLPISITDSQLNTSSVLVSHSGSLGDCVSGCPSFISGFLAGAQASHAGAIYSIQSERGFSIQGAVALQR